MATSWSLISAAVKASNVSSVSVASAPAGIDMVAPWIVIEPPSGPMVSVAILGNATRAPPCSVTVVVVPSGLPARTLVMLIDNSQTAALHKSTPFS